MTPASTLFQLRTLQAANPVTITIRRGPQKCTLVAAPATSDGRMCGSDGLWSSYTLDDWLIAAEDFTLTSPAKPQRGDEITIDADGTTYHVEHPDQSKPAIENHGACKPVAGWRVHSVPD